MRHLNEEASERVFKRKRNPRAQRKQTRGCRLLFTRNGKKSPKEGNRGKAPTLPKG